ncbi:MAG: N-acetyl-alpha-D-glucosaminyl L-malate synthase BshA [Flavobacteriales bacterium]|nr:N-acetyl-alpha-D-glucosaminyl L-malate synthase BshA [Flavobacteriales bacterium]
MNVGVICYPTYGGSGVVATELGKSMAAKGHVIHFISYDQPARLDFFSENLFYHEVNVSDYPLFKYPPYEIALTSKIVEIVLSAKLDILHVHYAIPHAAAAVMAKYILKEKGINIPIITTLHGTDITLVGKDATYEPVIDYALNQSDGVTAVSQSLKSDTNAYFHITQDIEVIPNFVDMKRFSKKPKEHFKKAIAPNSERIIVHTSNFRKVKRVDDVMRVYKKIQEKIPSKLLMVGDGPERVRLERECRESNICDQVSFLGKQDAVEEILSIADLFLMPSETESFGLAALEAMACEVPVISTNTGGQPEVNIDGVTGYTTNVGDIELMAEKALYILNSDDVLRKFKDNAVAHAKTYDIHSICPLYEQYYEKIINRVKMKMA